VERFNDLDESGRAKRKMLVVEDTVIRSNKGTALNSSVNWHSPGGTKALVGRPCNDDEDDEEEEDDAMIAVVIEFCCASMMAAGETTAATMYTLCAESVRVSDDDIMFGRT
jgi:hypothetical protein